MMMMESILFDHSILLWSIDDDWLFDHLLSFIPFDYSIHSLLWWFDDGIRSDVFHSFDSMMIHSTWFVHSIDLLTFDVVHYILLFIPIDYGWFWREYSLFVTILHSSYLSIVLLTTVVQSYNSIYWKFDTIPDIQYSYWRQMIFYSLLFSIIVCRPINIRRNKYSNVSYSFIVREEADIQSFGYYDWLTIHWFWPIRWYSLVLWYWWQWWWKYWYCVTGIIHWWLLVRKKIFWYSSFKPVLFEFRLLTDSEDSSEREEEAIRESLKYVKCIIDIYYSVCVNYYSVTDIEK